MQNDAWNHLKKQGGIVKGGLFKRKKREDQFSYKVTDNSFAFDSYSLSSINNPRPLLGGRLTVTDRFQEWYQQFLAEDGRLEKKNSDKSARLH